MNIHKGHTTILLKNLIIFVDNYINVDTASTLERNPYHKPVENMLT